MDHICPHCGAALHECASFCPHCAKSVNGRTEPKPPRPIPLRVLRTGIALLVILAVAAGVYINHRPKIYDAQAEVIYTDADGTYQVLLTLGDNRYAPTYEIHQNAELEGKFRFPVRFYVNHVDSGAEAGKLFLQKMERCTAEILQPDDSPSPMVCSEPAPHNYAPDATLVTLIDYTGRSETGQLLVTLYMKNGDVIKLRQDVIVHPIQTHNYDATSAPMATLEELQALVDRIAETTNRMTWLISTCRR